MPAFCIPQHVSRKLLEVAKRGEFDMVKLYNMDSTERRSFFQQYTTKENAEGINAGFEKAMASKQKDALNKWTNEIFNPSDKKKRNAKDVIDRINDLKKEDLIGSNADAFYQDLIASRLGVGVTEQELTKITQMAEKMEKMMKEEGKFGLPPVEYFQAKREMQDYLYSLVPASNLKIATSTLGRGALLTSIKSPLTNVVGNTVQGMLTSMERRLASGSFSGSNPGLIRDYVNHANEIYSKSGYDITRMIDLAEDSKLIGEDIIHSQGDGVVRKAGRVVEDVIFKKLLGAPDVTFSAISFADSADIHSTKIAQKQGLSGAEMKTKAKEIFLDATRVDPKTIDGEIVRAQSIADAQYSTFTNDSTYSTIALGIRKLFNVASGDLRIGDQIMPFVKTPANVIGSGLDFAGLSSIRATFELPDAIREFKDGNTVPMNKVVRDFVKSGLGFSLAFILSSLFEPDDFIGEYPTSEKERQLLELKNATPNSLKVGNKWISLDYFGAIGAPLVGMLYAKKYGAGLPDSAYRYAQGVGIQSLKVPGFNEFYDTIESIKNSRPDKSKSLKENLTTAGTNLIDFIRARTVPAIVYDVAKATDTKERKVDKSKLGDKIKSTIPGIRQTLPVDKTVTGDERNTESPLSTLLFGARVKTNRDTKVVNELSRLDSTGNLPSITDVEKTSTRVKEFKSQVDKEEYTQAMDEFFTMFGKKLDRTMDSPQYRRSDDEKKAKMIDKTKEDTLDLVLKKHGYRTPRKK